MSKSKSEIEKNQVVFILVDKTLFSAQITSRLEVGEKRQIEESKKSWVKSI